MKLTHCLQIMVMAGLIPLTGHATMIMDADDFEHDVIGAQPFKATNVSPAATTGSAFVAVVDQATNTAGTGKGVRLFDNDTSTGLQLEYDFTIISDIPPTQTLDYVARLSAVQVDLSFAPLSTTGTGNNHLSITLGEHLTDQSNSSTHFLIFRLLDDGTIDFLSTTDPDSTGKTLQSADNTLSIFANDYDTQSIAYLGPDGTLYNLPSNAVAYWLNGNRITFGGQGYTMMEDRATSNGTVFNSTNNLGRLAIVSTAGNDGLDYIFDNIVISDLDSEQNPTGKSALVSNSLAGLVYTGYANEGQTNAVNTVPDYSSAGYKGGGVPIPFVPVAVTVNPSGDTTGVTDANNIQIAINQVSALSVGADGFRGAVKLEAGEYTVVNTLNINTSGVVIRGAGSQENGGTRITFNSTSEDKPDLFFVGNSSAGSPNEINGTRTTITDAYVPVGAKSFNVSDGTIYDQGDTIIIQMMFNEQWLTDLGMGANSPGNPMGNEAWTTGYFQNIKYRRIVTEVNGNTINIDATVLQTIENLYGGAEVYKYQYPNGLKNIGFECLRLESSYANETDENHGWDAIHLENLEDGWVRQVTARYFVFSLVHIRDYCRRITVEDCANFDAVCTSASGRRYSFTVDESDSILWQRCLTRGGRHDFASGSKVEGPNVYVDCRATETFNDIGPHHRYSTGQLYDNIFGGEMNVQNRLTSGSGHGWSGAQIMFWNCDASSIISDAPHGAMNWVVGSSTYQTDSHRTPAEPFGIWDSLNQAVTPRSLYYTQLADRLGTNTLNSIILPQQKAGNVWGELLLWDGDGLFLDEVVAWADEETTAKAGVLLTIGGAVRNLQMLDRGGLTYSWTKVSGPGSVIFTDDALLETTATFSQNGSYVLQLLVDDGTVQASANLMVEVLDTAGIPTAPANLVAVASDGSVFLSWDDNGEPDLERYVVYRSLTSLSGYTALDTNVSLNEFLDSTVVNGITYYYRVSAVDTDNDESLLSDEAFATPQLDTIPPAAPTGLAATAGDSNILLNWDDNGEPDLERYAVYRSLTSTSGYTAISNNVSLSEYEDNSVINGTTYYYVVTATDEAGNESLQSAGALVMPQEPSSLNRILFGINNDSLGGFTTSTPNPAQETWSVETDSVRYINDGSFNGGTENSSLLQAFALDRSVGKSYIIEGVITPTDGYADNNNRVGIYLFGDVDDLAASGGPEQDETGALCLLYNFDSGQIRLFEGIDRTQLTSTGTNPTRAGDDNIFGSDNIITLTAEISFLGSGQIQIVGSFKDEYDATTTLTSTVTAADYTGDYFGFATRARNVGTTDNNAPFTMDYKSFSIDDSSAPASLLPTAPSGLTATPGNSLVNLDWDENTEDNLVSYRVYRKIDPESYSTTPLAVVSHPSTEFTDSSTENDTTYYYVVTAVDSNSNESAPSVEVSVSLLSDSDGDGVLDFFEYLYGSDPTLPSSSGFQFTASLDGDGTNIILNWEVKEGFILGQDYEIEVSTDLSTWYPLPEEDYSLTLTENNVTGKTEVELTLIEDYGSKVFLKLLQPTDN